MDTITVLTVRTPKDAVMTKRLFRATNGAIGKLSYDRGYKFDAQVVPIADLADLAEVLFWLNDQPQRVVIRGLPIGATRDVHRRLTAFQAAPEGHHWLFLDFDEIAMPMLLDPDDDPEIMLGFLVRLLPQEFHHASYVWHWSSGHGLDGGKTLRAHLFFWSHHKHTDREFENWGRTINGEAGVQVIDPSVLRTVQPNFVAAPILGSPTQPIADPVRTARYGAHVGRDAEVVVKMPTQTWEQVVREQERAEYQELVDYGVRPPLSAQDYQLSGEDRYIDYLARIGDDLDGFYDPMTKAIWHWARNFAVEQDDAFKTVLRQVVRNAKSSKQRDLDEYLSDYKLDASLRGAREKQISYPVRDDDRAILRRYSQIKRLERL